MIKAIIFDMDGLMIDSEKVSFECYQEEMKPLGLAISKDFYLQLLGKTVPTITKSFRSMYGPEFPMTHVLTCVHQRMAQRFAQEGVPLKPGLIKLLNYLKDNHYATIVATSSGYHFNPNKTSSLF